MSLQDQIDQKRHTIRTDSYSMSIGELINLYQSNEIDIHPDFQRVFRWRSDKKTKLIESILLGIPLPPIFVSQRDDGVWDVIDGVQRLSTIFQFAGILKDENDQLVEPLVLEGTKYLPELKNKIYEARENGEDAEQNCFTPAQRIFLKRSKIDVTMILRESTEEAKYDLFQRLNTGGTTLSAQEVRNCLVIMSNKRFYEWLDRLSRDSVFRDCISVTERALEERYEMELLVRFVVLRKSDPKLLSGIEDVGGFLTDELIRIAEDCAFDAGLEENAARRTFSALNKTLNGDCFRRYDHDKQRHLGAFLVSAYEAIALGIGFNCENWPTDDPPYDLTQRVQELWTKDEFVQNSGSGVPGRSRLRKIVPFGREHFA